MQPLKQKDFFGTELSGLAPLELAIGKIQAPRTEAQKKAAKRGVPIKQNFHIPSFKNAKRWITKLPNGKPLKKPFLITSPEFQQWMEKAAQSLELQCISACQTEGDATRQVRLKLFVMLSRLPEDDSVNDLVESRIIVERVNPGEEGARIVIERLR